MTYPLTFYVDSLPPGVGGCANGRVMRYLLPLVLLTSGCAYNWQQTEPVNTALVHKVESELASDFCTKLLGGMKRGCAIRLTNTSTGVTNCVMVVHPGDLEAVRHEGGHCMGQDH